MEKPILSIHLEAEILAYPQTRELSSGRGNEHILVSKKIPEGITPRFADCSFANYKIFNERQGMIAENLLQYAVKFRPDMRKSPNIILLGHVGTGKGHLITAMSKKSWGTEDEGEVLDYFQEVDLLFLDEASIQLSTQSENLIVYDVLNYRYQYFKPTIVISNSTLDTLKECLTPRIIDRLLDNNGMMFACDWKSFREVKK